MAADDPQPESRRHADRAQRRRAELPEPERIELDEARRRVERPVAAGEQQPMEQLEGDVEGKPGEDADDDQADGQRDATSRKGPPDRRLTPAAHERGREEHTGEGRKTEEDE